MSRRRITWRQWLSVGLVSALVCGLAGLAVASQGLPIAQVELNDSGVWVTNESVHHLGRFNHSVGQLDGVSYVTELSSFDVIQEKNSVFAIGTDDGSLVPLNPATLTLGTPQVLGGSSQVSLGGGMVGVFIPEQGRFWLIPVSSIAGFDPLGEVYPPAVEDLPKNSVTAVGSNGVGYVVDPSSGVLKTVTAGEVTAENSALIVESPLPGLTDSGSYSMTVVGSTPVVLDHSSGMLYLGTKRSVQVMLDEGDPVELQAVSASGSAVAYSTPSSLVSQALSGGDPQIITTQNSGVPSQPVAVGGCTYAVWSGSGDFVRDCIGEAQDAAQVIPDFDPSDVLRFRVNWGLVVLNQIKSGGIWIVSNLIQKVDNWDSAIKADHGNEDQDSNEEINESEKIDRSAENRPPIARDDVFGARAGQSVLLPVVENDIDEDGDLLTVELLGKQPLGYELNLVYSQSVVQMNVPPDASGVVGFEYRVIDGRGGDSKASVQVTIIPDTENSPPESVRATMLTVSSGQRVTYNVLTNWRDPDGDTIFLLNAVAPKEDMVTPTQDGTLTFQDGGLTTGIKTVQITVSDGRQATTEEITVNVLPSGNRPPVPTPDLVSGTVGTPIEIHPLENDMDPNGNPLRLTGVEGDPAKCSLEKELSQGLVTATCLEPGSVYLTYTLTDGPSANIESWIRILVTPVAADDAPPIAVPDTVLLAPGQDAYVHPLDNDVNPLGYPLVVTGVTVEPGLPIGVFVLDCELVKITPNQEFTSPISITYTVSNGKGYATSRITVVPLPAPEKVMPPTAVDDIVTVRAGDIATIPVLANDTQANGIALRLRPDLPQSPDPDREALVFTSGNVVRVHARQKPGTYTVLYQVEVVKGSAEPDTGRLTIYVTPPSENDDNQAPKPKDVQARTLAGRPVTIPIPLDGIDPNGDHVMLTGLGTAPGKGLVNDITATGFVYTPGVNSSGGDEFSYLVRDRLGREATGRVRIGIAPASNLNRAPNTVTDFAESTPGGIVTIPVTLNDTDPDGDTCCYLIADSVESESFTGETKGQNVEIIAPMEPGSYWGTYVVSDEFGLESTGVIVLTVANDILPKKPIVADDIVSATDALANEFVTLDVLKNDYDPDGDVTLGSVTVEDLTATVSNNKVTVAITSELQILDYYVTDPDGMIGHGFITVPGVDKIPPQFKLSARELQVKAGQTVTFTLADYVVVRPGRSPRVVDAAGVSAWNGTAVATSVTQLTYTAPSNYSGPAGISVKVTDGATLDDDTGLVGVVTIPVYVVDETVTLPTMQGSILDVEVGETSTLNLATLVSNLPPLTHGTYTLISLPTLNGVEATIAGIILSVNANPTVASGQETTVTVSLSAAGHDVQAQITVRIVSSKKPLPQAVDDKILDAIQSQTVCVPVTANDTNPFPNSPLTIVSATVETGLGSAATGCDGGQGVSVTPAGSFLGEMIVRYVIVDVTGDPSRQATGRIYLNVRGRPNPPTGLHIDQVGNKMVILSWLPADNNGSPITGYTVQASPSAPGYPKACSTTTCTLDGLTNNVTYRFTVTATNEVGTSDPSMASEEARPDAFPYPLDTPNISFADKSLLLSWVPKGSPGSPVTSYDIEISPPPPSGVTIFQHNIGTSSIVVALLNGTAYKMRVCARNLVPGVCEEESHWSPWSQEEIPAGPPNQPEAPTWTRLNPVGGEGQVEVCWKQPYNNGDAIASYTLRTSTGVTYPVTPTGTITCKTVPLPTSETGYTFTVSARNKAGAGSFSLASPEFISVAPPGAVSNLTATDHNNFCIVSFSPASLNGARSSEVTYNWWASNGASGNFGTNTAGEATGLPNNGTYSITVWATTTVQGYSQDGPKTTVGNCRPYGVPNVPGVSAVQDADHVKVSWSIPSPNGRAVARIEVSIDDGAWTSKTANGSQYVGDGCGQLHSIKARTIDEAGQVSSVVSAAAKTQACASPSITIRLSGVPSKGGEYITVTTSQFTNSIVRCELVWADEGLVESGGYWGQGPDATFWPNIIAKKNAILEIECDGVSSGRVVVN